MTTIHFRLKDGSSRSVAATNGRSLMENALNHNLRGIDAECGGACACATCHVLVDAAWLHLLPAPDALEDELLDAVAAGRQAGSRLSCQISITPALDGLVVQVPHTQS